MGRLADFRAAAISRQRFPDDGRLTPASLFALVRDMPYRAVDTDLDTAVGEWRASGCTRHALLRELYREFGLYSILIEAAHEVNASAWLWLPPALRDEVESSPIPDVYTFLRLQTGSEWMAVDASWPASLAPLGVPVNQRFEPGRDMNVACDPDELFHVPDEADPIAFRANLLARVAGADGERHARFFAALEDWFESAVAQGPR